MFKKELDKTGKGIVQCLTKRRKTFFNKIDKMYKAKNEISAGQKKLPPALQKAIKDKEQKEELDKDDTSGRCKKSKRYVKEGSQSHAVKQKN